jgi:hypothetical protein
MKVQTSFLTSYDYDLHDFKVVMKMLQITIIIHEWLQYNVLCY